MSIVWLCEHSGGEYEDYFSEIVGVFLSCELAMEALPDLQWVKKQEPKRVTAEDARGHSYEIYALELNRFYPEDYL